MFKRILIAIGVVGVLVIIWIFFHGKNVAQLPSSTTASNQSPDSSGNSFLQNISNSVENIVGLGRSGQSTSSASGQSSQSPSGQQQNFSGTTSPVGSNSANSSGSSNPAANGTSNSSGTNSPVTVASALPLPTEPNFTAVTFATSSDNSTASIQNYAGAAASATANFDLINNSSQIAAEYQTLNPDTLQKMRDQSKANRDAIAKLSVPSEALGMAQRYYLVYDNYAQELDATLSLFNPKATGQQRQQKLSQLGQLHDQLAIYMEKLAADIQIVNSLK